MFRKAATGLAALIVVACGPADQTSAGGSAATAPAAPATPASNREASGPMSWEAMQDHYRQLEVEPTDPLEALEYRAVVCSHLSGEIGSENPERERYLEAQIVKHRCEEALLTEVRAMRDARSDEPAVVARLDTILAELPY